MESFIETNLFYDPPSGWMYGFPKPYRPLKGEALGDTLLRDGYPEVELKSITVNGEVRYVRFIGTKEDILKHETLTNPLS